MISVKLIQDSISEQTDKRLTTFEWEYPRFIHAEVMTHRLFSRNAGSSRAIPVASMIELARSNIYVPKFRYNQSGMQAAGLLTPMDMTEAVDIWLGAASHCLAAAEKLNELKVHKQWANRMLEWFAPIKIAVTSTEWDNFLWLRNDFEAQDEIEILAGMVEKALAESDPMVVPHGHAHVPYVHRVKTERPWEIEYYVDGQQLTINEALKVSASVCAQMSYRKENNTLEKANDLYGKFMEGRRVHASPFEHQGIVTDEGSTHTDHNGMFWSGNLCGWTQFRHLIPNNTCHDLQFARMKEAAGL